MLHTHEISHISRPTHTIDPAAAAVASGSIIAAGMSRGSARPPQIRREDLEGAETINALQYTRLYTVAGIPIVDFIVAYIVLYVLNTLVFRLHQGSILVAAIPVTIIFSLFTNPRTEASPLVLSVVVASVFLILLMEIKPLAFYSEK